MDHYFTWILFNVILIFNCSNALPLSDFIPFGRSNGDSQFSGIYRTATRAIAIPTRLPYFTQTFDSIFVSSVYVYVNSFV